MPRKLPLIIDTHIRKIEKIEKIEKNGIYTSEDLKWNASGVLDFNSLLISDP
jgi:hypothetical protein